MLSEFFGFRWFQAQGNALGVAGFLFLAAAAAGFFLFSLPKGIGGAIKGAAVLSAAGVLVLEVALLLTDFKEMSLHATNFAVWSWPEPNEIFLISNWFALVVASGLTALGLKARR